jgi:[ribosomal protein S5]-alanine N-acetyltransferase
MKYLLDGEYTDRLVFRKIDIADFNDWLVFHKDPGSSAHWHAERADPETECRKWYDKQYYRYANNLGGMNALVEKQSGKLIGHCGLLIQTVDAERELEVAYSLIPEFRNKGYATEAARKCLGFAFENLLADSLISIISLTNIPSQRVALKMGMAEEKRTVYDGNEVIIFSIDHRQTIS